MNVAPDSAAAVIVRVADLGDERRELLGDGGRRLGVGVEDRRDHERLAATDHDAHVGALVVLVLAVGVGAVDRAVLAQRDPGGVDDRGRDGHLAAGGQQVGDVDLDRCLEVGDRRLGLRHPAGDRALRTGRLDRLHGALGAGGGGRGGLGAHSLSSK